MALSEQNYKVTGPDVISSSTSIRLPGVAGAVSWLARIDLDNPRLRVLEIGLPNGVVDVLNFDNVKGVEVSRKINDRPVETSVEVTRQILHNAQIIAGLHLQIAIENVFGHG